MRNSTAKAISEKLMLCQKTLKECRRALEMVGPMFDSMAGEFVSKKGPATDWGLVNDCLVAVNKAVINLKSIGVGK